MRMRNSALCACANLTSVAQRHLAALRSKRSDHTIITLNQSGLRSCKLLSDFLLVVEKQKQWSKPMGILAVTALLCDNPKPSGITDNEPKNSESQ